jgi:hypothetical protein
MYSATSVVGVPSQENFAASNWACLLAYKGSSATVFCRRQITLPSRGATL